jgi:hypothetical protein
MRKRTPDIYLSPRQLIERARQARAEAGKLGGRARDRVLAEASADEAMANMKRWVGDSEVDKRPPGDPPGR